MNANIRLLYQSPAAVVNKELEERFPSQSLGKVRTTPLIKCPRTLEVLWTEFEFGLNGNKPVKILSTTVIV